ncbi:hypothetical protein BJ875DRAFT_479028 [Amylocarpus encephaloides]|uniref:Uncharacterized protein n=1 Tax=Amylocarpus encephaloides TaxID=45428 RepID=A0A9P8BZ99_9HELO|nr:hypothetical protein BJ875DRAFT_479028 [Amylocarpus encephaloides]
MLTPKFTWHENDPPATTILAARLWAKYYGAQSIAYRPFVLKILEYSAFRRTGDIEPKVLDCARICIQALIKSTSAFHGLSDPGVHRLLVENVWVIAHAHICSP